MCHVAAGAAPWEDDLSRVAADGRRLTEAAAWWAVASVVLDAMSVRSVAATLGCSWDCANDAVLSKGMARLINDERRLRDVLAFFDHTFSGNGPTEAVNGRLEHLRGIALGFTKTSATTSPEASCTPEDSDKPYKTRSTNHEPRSHTRKPEEPLNLPLTYQMW